MPNEEVLGPKPSDDIDYLGLETFIDGEGEMFFAYPKDVAQFITDNPEAYPPGWDVHAERRMVYHNTLNPSKFENVRQMQSDVSGTERSLRDAAADWLADEGVWVPPEDFHKFQAEPIVPVLSLPEKAAEVAGMAEMRPDWDYYEEARNRASKAAMEQLEGNLQHDISPYGQWLRKSPEERHTAPFRDFAAEVHTPEGTEVVEHPDPAKDRQMAKDTQTWHRFMSEQEGKGEQ